MRNLRSTAIFVIWIILINKYITLSVFTTKISLQTSFVTIRIGVFWSKVRKFLNKSVSPLTIDLLDASILQFLVFSKHFLNLFFFMWRKCCLWIFKHFPVFWKQLVENFLERLYFSYKRFSRPSIVLEFGWNMITESSQLFIWMESMFSLFIKSIRSG